MKISINQTHSSMLHATDFKNLEFGRYTADHMFVADYVNGSWQQPAVVPYDDLRLNPATLALHYGQTIFEGMKAFRMDSGDVSIFRIARHHDRLVRSAERMCMQAPSRQLFEDGLKALIGLDHAWVPAKPGALYIRPFIIATEARFGVKVSDTYKFIIITGPVPELFTSPIRLKLENRYIRAARGGTGAAKCGGNYGASFYPVTIARSEGYDQVLWTDVNHEFIEESGMMNVMFVIDGRLVTPALSDSILDGVTRASLIQLARDRSIVVEERPVAVAELQEAFRLGTITEAFGVGTAAVVSPIGIIGINGVDHALPASNAASIQHVLRTDLDEIRVGTKPDRYNWNTVVREPVHQPGIA